MSSTSVVEANVKVHLPQQLPAFRDIYIYTPSLCIHVFIFFGGGREGGGGGANPGYRSFLVSILASPQLLETIII